MSEQRKSAMTQENGEDEGIDLLIIATDMYKGFKRIWWAVLAFIAIGAVLGDLVSTDMYVPVYRADATFAVSRALLTSTGNDSYGYSYDYGTVSQLTDTFPYIISSDLLMDVVADDMGVDKVDAEIYASGVDDTNLFTISVEAGDPNYAFYVLQSVVLNYPKIAEYIIGDTQLNTLIKPVVPRNPCNEPNTLRYTLYGGAAAMLISLLVLFLVAITNQSIKKTDDITNYLNQTPIGVVPQVKFKRRSAPGSDALVILNRNAGVAFRESIRSVRTRALRDMDEKGAKVLMITSTCAVEGKSTISTNLAISIAQKHMRVVLVDADLRKSNLCEYLGMDQTSYVMQDVIDGTVSLEGALEKCRVEGLSLLSCGISENPLEDIGSEKFQAQIRALRDIADYVIIDTPPCGMLADATVIAPMCDCALFVVRQNGPSRYQIIDALQQLEYANLPVLGCVLNGVLSGISGYGYGYGYGYGSRYAYNNYSYNGYGVDGKKAKGKD